MKYHWPPTVERQFEGCRRWNRPRRDYSTIEPGNLVFDASLLIMIGGLHCRRVDRNGPTLRHLTRSCQQSYAGPSPKLTSTMMSILRIFIYLAAFTSVVPFLRPKGPPLSIVLWVPKLAAQALTPVTALLGTAGIVAGIFRRDWRLLLAGIVGATLSTRQMSEVPVADDPFAQAFGSDWRQRVVSRIV